MHPLELLWGDKWCGRGGRVVAPQGQCWETRLGTGFIPRDDLHGCMCSHCLAKVLLQHWEKRHTSFLPGRFFSSHQLPSNW